MDTYSIENRIDALSIAYVTSRSDVSDMSVEEFFEAFKKAHDEFGDFFDIRSIESEACIH